MKIFECIKDMFNLNRTKSLVDESLITRSSNIKSDNTKREEMKNILKVVNNILYETEYHDTHPVFLVIKHYVDIELSSNISKLLATHDPNQGKKYNFSDILPNQKNSFDQYLYIDSSQNRLSWYDFYSMSRLESCEETIFLGYDSVIAHPWNINRFMNALTKIAMNNDWQQQKDNHDIVLFMPYGITFVENGNHSITKGILNNIGNIKTAVIYNVGSIHDEIYTDGVYYYRRRDDSIYAIVENFNLAVVFEIGSLIYSNRHNPDMNIRFHSKRIADYE